MRRLLLSVLAVLAASALSGCERLCAPNAAGKEVGVFCPESDDNPLNHRPSAAFTFSYPSAGEDDEPERLPRPDTVAIGRDVILHSLAGDPDGDALFLEWDLDGDGRFERSGYESVVGSVDTVFRAVGSHRLRLRVTDFPRQLGAPGERTTTQEVHAIDPTANRSPRAVLTASPNPAVAGEAVTFDATGSSDPDFYDAPGAIDPPITNLRASWAFEPLSNNFYLESGGFRVSRRFFSAGTEDVKVKVRDFFGAESIAEVSVRVVTGHPGNRPPTARFVAIPNPVEVGGDRRYDASASSDPDGDVLRYCWDADGDDDPDPFYCLDGDPYFDGTSPGFPRTPGDYPIHLWVTDSSGARDHATVVHRVVPASEDNLPPTARFTPMPFSPLVRDPVALDGSASSDPEGEPIGRYEWDLDGNGSFETDRGGDPIIVTSYETPGERFVRLRVTDAGGATGTTGRTINVRSPTAILARTSALARPFQTGLVARSAAPAAPAAPAGPAARAQRARTTELPFSASVRGRPRPGSRGERRRRGSQTSLLGVLGRGRLQARLVDPAGRATRAERRLRRFLRAPWRARVSFHLDPRTGRWTAQAIALARARRATACLRLRLEARSGRHPTGRLEVLGGSARVRGGARFRFMLNRNGSATALGRLRARTGKHRPLPRRCRRLAPSYRVGRP